MSSADPRFDTWLEDELRTRLRLVEMASVPIPGADSTGAGAGIVIRAGVPGRWG